MFGDDKMKQMKDSGIEWIGQIPEDWNIVRVKQAFIRKNEKAQQENPVVLSLARAGVKVRDVSTNEGQVAESYYNYNPVSVGDLLLNPMDLYSGANCSLSEVEGVISPAYVNLKNKEGYFSKFYDYYFKVQYWMMVLFAHGKGVSFDNRWTLNHETLMNFPIVSPNLETQKRISDFLDKKCGKIDRYIEKQQQVIEKLKTYKQSVITEAVTKGLDPTAPMKDSGIDVMGDIPTQWRIVRLKFLMTHIVDCPHETPNYSADGDYWVIRTADQDYGFLRPDADMYRLNEEEYTNRIRRLPLNQDDIVYGREGERWGLACLVPQSDKYCLGQRMMQFRCNTNLVLPQYAMWALNSWYVYLQGSVDTLGSTSPHVNISTMRNYSIPIPPIEEQKTILNAINKKIVSFQDSINAREKLINKLNEYKKSLIYEAVTGKMEV